MKKKTMTAIVGMMLVLSLLAGCGGNGGGTDGQGRDDVIINLPADISELNPYNTANQPDFQVFANIYEVLIDETENGYQPVLAESYERSDDGLTYTVKLREGVKFHNGEEMKASDVVFSYEQAMQSPYVGGSHVMTESIAALDDYTVQFNLHDVYAPFITSHTMTYIVSEKAMTELGADFSKNPIGTGAYKFVSAETGQEVRLTRHDDYWGGPAPIKDVILKVILNPATLSIAIEAGDVDLALNVPPGDFQRLGDMENLALSPWESKSLNFMLMNTYAPPFDNPLVRQAVAHAVDRQALIDMASDGYGVPTDGPWNRFTIGYSPDVRAYEYDLDKAKALMADAGYADGLTLTFKTIEGVFQSQAQILQDSLDKIGITVSIDMMDQSAFLGDLFTANYEMANLAIALGGDADEWAALFTTEGGMNMTGISNPGIDELFAQASSLTDTAARVALYRDAAQMVIDDASYIFLYFNSQTYVHDSNLSMGWIDSNGTFKCSELRWN